LLGDAKDLFKDVERSEKTLGKHIKRVKRSNQGNMRELAMISNDWKSEGRTQMWDRLEEFP
jgi:hypothetical protein